MNEAQTRLNLIDPAIRAAGWTEENDCQVLVEQTVAPGRVGKVRGKPLRADYILCHRGGGRGEGRRASGDRGL